mmetsp:Transcript_11077/g.12454  ORF Transcript_11077/g.12454 Transcript_11077/m.12454 type:complete len:103 (+) Transcript_11077:227-535(+)
MKTAQVEDPKPIGVINFSTSKSSKFNVKKKMVLSRNSIVLQKKNKVKDIKPVDETIKQQMENTACKNWTRAKSLLCSPRREPNQQHAEIRTPVIVRRSFTDN